MAKVVMERETIAMQQMHEHMPLALLALTGRGRIEPQSAKQTQQYNLPETRAAIDQNHWGNRQDERWIKTHQDDLLKKHPNQHIAVLNHAVLAAADSQEALEKYLTEKKLPLFLPVFHKVEVMAIADMIQLGESETGEPG